MYATRTLLNMLTTERIYDIPVVHQATRTLLNMLTRFEHVQYLGLQFESHFTDFIEEDASIVRFLEEPFLSFSATVKNPIL